MKYDVTIHFQIEANSEEHAVELAYENFCQDDILSGTATVTNVQFCQIFYVGKRRKHKRTIKSFTNGINHETRS